MKIFTIQELNCDRPETDNENDPFPHYRIKNMGVLVSVLLHVIVLSLLAVSPAAQMIPGFNLLMVNLVQEPSLSPAQEMELKAAFKQQKASFQKPMSADVMPPVLVEQKNKRDMMETPKQAEPEQDILLTQDKEQPRILLASAVAETRSGSIPVQNTSIVNSMTSTNNEGESNLAGSGQAINTGHLQGMGHRSTLETAFGEPNAPAFVDRKMPVYPRLAERLGKEGTVVLKLFIDEQGQLHRVQVVESTWQGFTEAALDAVRKSSFSPGRRNGKTVFSEALLAVRFSMK